MRLKADGLACTRGGREIFHSVSFGLSSGEAMVVTGRNGAGKSSLLRMIAGLVWISSGRLELDGGGPDTPLPEQCHYLGHQDAMKPSLSVSETGIRQQVGAADDMTQGLELLLRIQETGARRTHEPFVPMQRPKAQPFVKLREANRDSCDLSPTRGGHPAKSPRVLC